MQIQAFPLLVRDSVAAPVSGGKSPTELLLSRIGLGEVFEAVVVNTSPRGAVLDAKGIPIALAGVTDLPLGTELALKVTSLTPQPQLQIESITTAASDSVAISKNASATETSGKAPLLLSRATSNSMPGLVLTLNTPIRPGAILIPKNPFGRLLADAGSDIETGQLFGEEAARATSPNPDELTAEELLNGSARLLLSQAADPIPAGESLAAIQHALADMAHEAPHLATLRSVVQLRIAIESLPLRPAEASGDTVARAVEKAGYQYEASLANHVDDPQAFAQSAATDFKAILIQMQADFRENASAPHPNQGVNVAFVCEPNPATPSRSATAELVRFVDGHLANIETHQALNLIAKANGGPLHFQIPVLFAKTPTTMTWEIESEDDSNEKPDGSSPKPSATRLVLRMDLEHFGRTVIEIRAAADSLNVQCFISQPEAIPVVEAGLLSLQEALQNAGFIDVRVSAASLEGEALKEDTSVKDMGTDRLTHHLLDVRA